MTLDDVQMFSDHFKRHPPLRTLVAACAAALGVKLPEPQEDKPQRHMGIEQARAWAAAASRGLVNPNG